MQKNCFRVSGMVIIMACCSRAFAPWQLPSSAVMIRNIASMNRPAWSSASSAPRSSLRHASLSISIRAAVNVKGQDGNSMLKTAVAKHDIDHTAINDAYGMIYHGSVPSHSKTAASTKENDVSVVKKIAVDAVTTADDAVLKVVTISNRFDYRASVCLLFCRRSRMEMMAKESSCAL
jgi:hypothetical protein